MKKVTSAENYNIVEKNGKFGLTYRDVVMLKPVYDVIHIKNKCLDTEDLLEPKLKYMKKHAIRYMEDNFKVVEADGRHGLLYLDQIIPGLEYDAIVKMTYRHYLFQEGNTCTLYRHNNIGYESKEDDMLIIKMAEFQIEGPLLLNTVLDELAKNHRDVYKDVFQFMAKTGDADHYISEYRHISCFVLLNHFPGAVQNVMIDNHFNTDPQGMDYYAILGEA